MGVNISIVDMRTGKEVPGWDWGRHAGDREVAAILFDLPRETIVRGDPREGITFERPKDVESFRRALHETFDFNTARWNEMCDLLAEDANRGLYFSW